MRFSNIERKSEINHLLVFNSGFTFYNSDVTFISKM